MTTPQPSRREFMSRSARAASALVLGSACAARTSFSAAAEGEWMSLFDGETLTGWHTNRKRINHGTGGRWAAEEGTLTGEQDPPGSGNGGILLTDKKFGDFELLIDCKPDWGVFLRSNEMGQCIQLMVDYHDNGNVGHLAGLISKGASDFNTRTFEINGKFDSQRNLSGFTTDKRKSAAMVGLDYSCTPAEWMDAWKLNDWNTIRVRMKGRYPRITTWLNDLMVCDFDGLTSVNEKYKQEEILETLGVTGSIALQVYDSVYCPQGSKSRWKNIKIRDI